MKKLQLNNILATLFLVTVMIIVVFVSKIISDKGYYRLVNANAEQYSLGLIVYDIDLVDNNTDKTDILGYMFQYMQPNNGSHMKMYLHDMKTGENIDVKLQQQDRPDVENFYSDGTNYIACGFAGEISNEKLNGRTYQIHVSYNDDENFIILNKYIIDGDLVDTISVLDSDGRRNWVSVTEIDTPKFSNDKLAKIIDSARLCGVLPNTGSYIYQLNDKLYYVIGSDIYYNTNGDCTLNWSYRTTQKQRVPIDNVDGYIGYMSGTLTMKENEDISLASDGYRVMVYDLPDYGILPMEVSCYNTEGVWDSISVRIEMD